MKKVIFVAVLAFVTFGVVAAELNAVEKLNSIVAPGNYKGSFDNKKCEFTFEIANDKAFLTLKKGHIYARHEVDATDEVRFIAHRGDFISHKILKTDDDTRYSTDTFRFFQNGNTPYVVIEQIEYDNRDRYTHKIECSLK